mgnify:CR=1 FL=1
MNRPDLTATITGLAAADAELTRTPSGTAVARARVPHAPRHPTATTGPPGNPTTSPRNQRTSHHTSCRNPTNSTGRNEPL